MIAFTAAEIATLIGVLTTAIVAIIGALKSGQTGKKIDAVTPVVHEINDAVNRKEPGTPTLATRIVNQDAHAIQVAGDLENDRRYHIAALERIATALKVTLPDPPHLGASSTAPSSGPTQTEPPLEA